MVPSKDQFIKAYTDDTPPKETVICDDGLYRYVEPGSGRISKGVIYVPPQLRQAMLYCFHASLLGGHAGVNKTNAKMRKHVGWLSMSRPLELISMDTIGPRPWKDGKFYVYCIVDHCTRYMFNIVNRFIWSSTGSFN